MKTVSKLLESVQPTVILGLSYEKFTNESFVLQPVSHNFIFKQLKDLKGKSATGLDGILARFLKDSTSVIAPFVTFLVNLSLSTRTVLRDWKMVRVIPLYKLDGHERMDNLQTNLYITASVKNYGESCQRSTTMVPTEV